MGSFNLQDFFRGQVPCTNLFFLFFCSGVGEISTPVMFILSSPQYECLEHMAILLYCQLAGYSTISKRTCQMFHDIYCI